jgi:ABC-2 type transport system permease protein/lipopolysaccharide transport system permease protein
MMAKTHFPRECFPLSQVLESTFTSVLALAPLVILLGWYHYLPKPTTLWIPLYLAVELPFVLGSVLLVSAVMVQARDLLQVVPIVSQFGMLATPVVWPFRRMGHLHVAGVAGSHDLRLVYSIVNPLAPVVDNVKASLLVGVGPQWEYLAVAAASALAYLVVGYSVFKRLEVNFADLT